MIEELQSSGGHPNAWQYTVRNMVALIELKRRRERRQKREQIGIMAIANGVDPVKVNSFLTSDEPE